MSPGIQKDQMVTLVNVMFVTNVLAITCIFLSCSPKNEKAVEPSLSDTLVIIGERDLIPEGTAYDPKTGRVFISSMYKRKIVAIEKNGSYNDFVKSGQDDLWGTLGMEVDTLRNKLWVISTKGKAIPTLPEIPDDRWLSKIYCYDLSIGKLQNIYSIDPLSNGEVGFNDLTVSKAGDVYITESLSGRLFVLNSGSIYVEEFLKPDGFTFLNGITLSPDNSHAFVSSSEGLLSINLTTKEYHLLDYEFTINPGPIDGLAFFKNSLIAHQSNQLTRFYLNESLDSILRHEIIDDKNLNGSTTGEVGGEGWYYYIANSQIQSGIDYEHKRVKPLDSLQDVVIRRKLIE